MTNERLLDLLRQIDAHPRLKGPMFLPDDIHITPDEIVELFRTWKPKRSGALISAPGCPTMDARCFTNRRWITEWME
jgi:hypothetical protein